MMYCLLHAIIEFSSTIPVIWVLAPFKNVCFSQWILSDQKRTIFHVTSSYVHARTIPLHCFDYFQVTLILDRYLNICVHTRQLQGKVTGQTCHVSTLILDRNDIMACIWISVGHFKCVLWPCSTYFMYKTCSMQFSTNNLLWFHLPGSMFLLYRLVNCPESYNIFAIEKSYVICY